MLNEVGLAALTGDRPSSVAVDPRGRFVYVANAGDATISQFSVDAFTGALIEIAPAVSAGTEIASVTVGRSGRFLYSAHTDADALGVFTIDATTGELFQIANLVVPDNLLRPQHVGVDPTGEFLFVSAAGDGTPGTSGVAVMIIDPRTGVPTRSAAPGLAEGVTRVAFHPRGRFLYAVLPDTDELATFEIGPAIGVPERGPAARQRRRPAERADHRPQRLLRLRGDPGPGRHRPRLALPDRRRHRPPDDLDRSVRRRHGARST